MSNISLFSNATLTKLSTCVSVYVFAVKLLINYVLLVIELSYSYYCVSIYVFV